MGRRLFSDRRLSRDGTIACVSCHDPARAFADGRGKAVGVFGRAGRRHSPALINRPAAPFVCVTAMLLAVIVWLGWRLLAQEGALDEQRLRDQLENTAALAARELDRALVDWENQLPAIASGQHVALPEHTVAIVFGGEGVLKHWGVDLPYYPQVRPPAEAPGTVFSDAVPIKHTLC